MLQVRLIGVPCIVTADGGAVELRGQKPWALLARVLLADRPLSRRELSVELFPETADPLGSVRWCLASIRRILGGTDVFTGDPIDRTLPDGVVVDVLELRLGALDLDHVGELLEGIDPDCGPEFSTWLLVARQRVASRIAAILREETITAISRGDHARAIEFAELAARRSPYDESAQVLLVKSLAAAGHGDAALRHVAEVERLFLTDLRIDPTPALRSAARADVAAAPPGVSAGAIATSLLTSGRAALLAGAIDAGIDCLRRAGAQAESAGDTALYGQCLLELGSALVHSVRGFDDEGSVLLGQAVELARSAGDRPTAVGALRERGYADTLAGRRHEAAHSLLLALSLAEGEPALCCGVHAVSALNRSDWGRHADAMVEYDEALDAARSVGDRRWQAWALGLGGWNALQSGDVDTAARWADGCLDVVHDLHWLSFEPWPVTVLAEARLTEAVRPPSSIDLERGFALSCALDDPCWEAGSGRLLAIHHARAGDTDAAMRWIVEARRRATRVSDTWVGMIGAVLLSEAEIRADAGDLAGADAAARELIALAARTHLDGILDRALRLTTR